MDEDLLTDEALDFLDSDDDQQEIVWGSENWNLLEK
jgi:hypothetical protein